MAKKQKEKKRLVKLQLVDNAGELWKAMSMWVYAAIALVGVAAVFVDGIKDILDPVTYGKVSIVLAALGIALRAVKQPAVSDK